MVQLQSFVVEILFSRFWTVHPCSQVDFFCLAANIIQLTVFITLRRVWSCVIPPKLVFIGLCVVQRHFKARSDFNEIWLFHTAEDCFQKVQLIVYWWIESNWTVLNLNIRTHINQSLYTKNKLRTPPKNSNFENIWGKHLLNLKYEPFKPKNWLQLNASDVKFVL